MLVRRFKGLMLLGVVLLMIGASVVWAAEPATSDSTSSDPVAPVPLRIQVREILEKYPEALAEIEALYQEFERPEYARAEIEGRGGLGFFGPRMARRHRGFMMNCWGNQTQKGRSMGGRWFR